MGDKKNLLVLDTVVAGYRKKQVLNGVSIDVAQGEITALIGHNGAGKSTLLRAIFGLLPIWSGMIVFDGDSIEGLSPRDLLHAGVVYIPQGSRVFTRLTVRENLEMGGITLSDGVRLNDGIDRTLNLFPALRPKIHQRAGTLSGGERQMLALASALILSPRLLLLDEPSLGLSPPLIIKAFRHIERISGEQGISVLIVEQKVREVLKIAHRVNVLRNGCVSYSGNSELLQDDARLRAVYL